MRIIRPIPVTDAILDSTDIPETDYTAWSAATTYVIGDRVILVSTHKIYESMQNSNLNKNPPDYLSGTTPYWMEVGATNAWKMFDSVVSSVSTKNTSMNVGLVSNMATAVALINIDATTVNITVTDPTEGEVSNETVTLLSTQGVIDAFTYFFSEFYYTRNAVFYIPPYSTAIVDISLAGTTVNVGEFGAEIGIVDYSVKSVDTFGNSIILERAFSNRGTYNVTLPNSYVEYVNTLLASLRVTPVVWIPTDAEYLSSPLLLYGFYKDFTINIQYATESACSIQIEGLI
jgi:hypothetical protein